MANKIKVYVPYEQDVKVQARIKQLERIIKQPALAELPKVQDVKK
jgi:hypothetical protein